MLSSNNSTSQSYYGGGGTTNSTYMMAVRNGGVCHGTVWQSKMNNHNNNKQQQQQQQQQSGGGKESTKNNNNKTKTLSTTTNTSSSSWFGSMTNNNVTEKIYTYSILCGTCFTSYENYTSYERGDPPISKMMIIGASAVIPQLLTNKKHTSSTNTTKGSMMIPQRSKSGSSSSNNNHLMNYQSSSSSSTTFLTNEETSFRIVSSEGSHIYCQTGSYACRFKWLHAFQTGLENDLLSSSMSETITTTISTTSSSNIMVPPPIPEVCRLALEYNNNNAKGYTSGPMQLLKILSLSSTTKCPKYCLCCGALERNENGTSSTNSSVHGSAIVSSTVALKATTKKVNNESVTENQEDSSTSTTGSSSYVSDQQTSTTHMKQHQQVVNLNSTFATPIVQYKIEEKVDVCFHCSIGQGLLDYMNFCNQLYKSQKEEMSILKLACTLCWTTIYHEKMKNSTTNNITFQEVLHDTITTHATTITTTTTDKLKEDEEDENDEMDIKVDNNDPTLITSATTTTTADADIKNDPLSSISVSSNAPTFDEYFRSRWKYSLPENVSNTIVTLLQNSIEFSSYQRQSTILDLLCQHFIRIPMDGDNSAAAATSSAAAGYCCATTTTSTSSIVDFLESLDEVSGYRKSDKKEMIQLKSLALRHAGDMGSSIKLLWELTAPSENQKVIYSSSSSGNKNEDDMVIENYNGGGSSILLGLASSPKANCSSGTSSSSSQSKVQHYATLIKNQHDIEMLSCTLEFFLDLCERNESSVAFFWPQLCQIHLRMLPAKNYMDLFRINLVEDFLLKIATKFSIQLALELTWSHTADLEESLLGTSLLPNSGNINGTTSSSVSTPIHHNTNTDTLNLPALCRQRRFAVIRFLCELESLLFDEKGISRWGNARNSSMYNNDPMSSSSTNEMKHSVRGSGMTLGSLLSPTSHQVELLQKAALTWEMLRVDSQKKLQQTKNHVVTNHMVQEKTSTTTTTTTTISVEDMTERQVAEKMRLVNNANYYTCHLNFSKRLSDIAEKLRLTDIDQRESVLQNELELLNSSGMMGGDPLNRVLPHGTDDYVRVVRIPSTEGHVFRSKERTPVLLLMEVVDERAETVNINVNGTENDFEKERDKKSKSFHVDSAASFCSSQEELEELDVLNVEAVDESDMVGSNMLDVICSTSNHNHHDVTLSPTRFRTFSETITLEGASYGDSPSPRSGALKRFDDSVPASPKKDVAIILSNVVENSFIGMDVPDLRAADQVDEQLQCSSSSSPTSPLTGNVESATVREETNISSPSSLNIVTSASEISGSGKKLLNFNAFASHTATLQSGEYGKSSSLAPTGDVRREVLNTIMMRGSQGNSIAAGTTVSVQRMLKELGRKQATELLLKDDQIPISLNDDNSKISSSSPNSNDTNVTREKLESLGLSPACSTEDGEQTSEAREEDEILEAIRLILIQNRVAQGFLSAEDAAKVLQHTSLSPSNQKNQGRDMVRRETTTGSRASPTLDISDYPTIDAGDVDPRLVGCGPLPPALLQAMTLWKAEMVSNAELLELVKRDIEFVKHSVLVDTDSIDKLKENSAFWGRFAFGERWAEKKSRIAASSPQGCHPGWDLLGVIVKSNDDLRQEAFVMQLIELSKEAFDLAGLELWLSPYRILATGRSTGVIECVRNAMSFDALKKRPGYGKGGLREHLQRMTEFTADPGEAFTTAQRNFVRSLAAYSLLSYLFLFKDRHNGNILLDTAGHVIHIDFGFVFGIAPGGSFSLEMSTPFKLTEEMLDVMGGLRSPLFSEFVTLFCCGFLALQSYSDTFITLVEVTCASSTFKCFEGRTPDEIVSRLRERFARDLSKEETVSFALDLIKQAVTSYGTRQYDMFQYLSQGIVA